MMKWKFCWSMEWFFTLEIFHICWKGKTKERTE
jgi:hypothetical protein